MIHEYIIKLRYYYTQQLKERSTEWLNGYNECMFRLQTYWEKSNEYNQQIIIDKINIQIEKYKKVLKMYHNRLRHTQTILKRFMNNELDIHVLTDVEYEIFRKNAQLSKDIKKKYIKITNPKVKKAVYGQDVLGLLHHIQKQADKLQELESANRNLNHVNKGKTATKSRHISHYILDVVRHNFTQEQWNAIVEKAKENKELNDIDTKENENTK